MTINAAELVTVPKSTKRTDGAVNSGAVASVLSVCQHHRLGALLSVALAAGLRLGEPTGLMWENVNLETGELQMRQQLQRVGKELLLQPLKTEKSRRTLMLPATFTRRGPGVRVGAPLHPRNVLRTLYLLLERVNVKRRRFHDPRHSAASL